ncbi:MAG TPA: CarD family transcriptional regulator, partial [Spirochaetota bacterium]|nr:CarD family transcriptional regulator [Spirochaetota bacterium]
MNFKNWLNIIFDDDKNYINLKNKFENDKILCVNGVSGSSNTLLISNIFKDYKKTIFFLTKSDEDAGNAKLDFESYGIEKVYYFPSVGTTPYQSSIMDEDTESQRLETLIQILKNDTAIVCLSCDALFFHIIPPQKIREYLINLSKKSTYDMSILTKKLVECGYYRVEKVALAGEFAIRGDILDIYYSSLKNPVRIEFFGDEIESIRSFNSETQKSEENLDEITIPPFKEIVYGKDELEIAIKRLNSLSNDEESKDYIFEKISNFHQFDGEHYYLNLFYEKSNILDYVENPILVIDDITLVNQKIDWIFREFETNYHETANIKKIKYKPNEMLFNIREIYEKSFKVVEVDYLHPKHENNIIFDFEGIPVYLGNLELFKNDIKKYLDEDYKVVLFAVNEIQATRLQGIFNQFAPKDDRFDFQDNGFSIVPLFLSNGFLNKSKKIIFLTDYEIFGKRKKISKHFWTKRTEVIDSFLDLKVGDYVVHIHHGVGQFVGIERVKSTGSEKDYIAIMYADSDKIFIPVEQLNFIQKYISGDFAKPKLDKIGGKGWTKTKERVKRSIEELAGELVKIYSYRLHQKGFAFSPDTQWQREFEAKFPYEETEDQLLAIEEVKRDMESPKPMDRLICGDVGFGKTEVAMRASFKSVMSGKQVMMLVPTTILAEQHY